jgi:16S rRNA (guanine1207-N2)-methyltransferase
MVALAGEELRLITRPGFPEWAHISQAAELLASHVPLPPGARVLVCPCGHGALAVWAARRACAIVVALDTNCVAVDMAARTLAANGCSQARAAAGTPLMAGGEYDDVLLLLPKGRDLARLLFLECYAALRHGGHLYLAGPNDGGIKSAIADAEALFGPATLLAYKGGNRAVSLLKQGAPASLPPSFSMPGVASGTYHTFAVTLQNETYLVRSRPGVFAWRQLDSGTQMLLDALTVHVTDEVLDVGCGYGLIGLHAARQATKGYVTLVDVDTLACDCAEATLAANGVDNARVLLGDGLAAVPGQRFSLIVSNPPFHSGHEPTLQVAESFVREAHQALAPRGRLVLVANRFLPYDRLMGELFGAVQTLRQTPQYHVLYAEKVYQRKARGKSRRRQGALPDEETIYQIPD